MPEKPILIQKANGDIVPFEAEKLHESLASAGASEATIAFISHQIEQQLVEGMTTRKIYQLAFNLLKKSYRPNAARYKLKRAVIELGPSGYPFEKFVGALLEDRGYQVKTGVLAEGKCVQHEVDVLAEKGHKRIAVECKFGNTTNKKVDIKVALYVHARFQDLANKWKEEAGLEGKEFQGGIITNGMLTEDAIDYGRCVGLYMVSWDYPEKGSLKEWIDTCHLHPVTSLTTLKKQEQRALIEQGFVLCRDLIEKEDLLREMRITPARSRKILDEVAALCR